MDSGEWLDDRYRLEERIDASYATEVWRAWDKVLSRPVALKFLAGDLLPESMSLSQLREKILAAAALSHQGIVTIYDYDETTDSDGAPISYVVMELVEGVSLADMIQEGSLSITTALQTCAQVAEALAAVHRAGMIHGDIRPSKIIITSDGIRVLGLGIAEESEWYALGYMPPEQTTGGLVTPVADVYALGVVLTECLTGQRDPHAPLPAAVSMETAAICHQCRSTGPEERPSAAEVAVLLREAAAALLRSAPAAPAPPPVISTTPVSETSSWTNHGFAALASLIVAALALVMAIYALVARHQTSATTTAPSAAAQAARPAGTVPATAVNSRTVNRVISALTRMEPVVDQGLNTGEIRSDVGLDLHNVIGNLKRQLTAGDAAGLRTGVEGLHEKIATRLREGAISRPRAQQLDTVLADGT